MASLKAGYVCIGALDSYRLVGTVNSWTRNVWDAKPIQHMQTVDRVVVKTGDESSIQREAKCLRLLTKQPRIRQLVDTISRNTIVLEHVESDLRSISISLKLSTAEIKKIAKHALQGLESIHALGIVHTDIKPQNILLSGFDGEGRNSDNLHACIADLGSASESSAHTISPKSFRSPEAWLGLPWGPTTDIWSFGAVIGSLMMGPHGELFGSHAPTEEERELEMVYRHHSMTGPFPSALVDKSSDRWKSRMAEYRSLDEECGKGMTWGYVVQGLKIPEEDGAFIDRILRMDPEDRPTASELLKDEWLQGC